MTDGSLKLSASATPSQHEGPCPRDSKRVTDLKARQLAKIRELGETLSAEGYTTLDEKARVLGLPRSTTWTILKANHKSSGLSAKIIKRVLAAPKLPPAVRHCVLEYIEEKSAGN